MGDDDQSKVRKLDFDRLNVITALGRGAKGLVFLVRDDGDLAGGGVPMALKLILRESIERKKRRDGNAGGGDEYRRVCFEQRVLSGFDHPLLPRLKGVVSTEKLVGYAIDYCPGRDLNNLKKNQTEGMFSDEIIRFYAAELVLALEYLHEQGIVYRDLKPDNIMIQENGHIMLIDFDLSTKLPPRTPTPSPNPIPRKKPPRPVKKKRFFSFNNCFNSGISPEDSVPKPPELGRHSTGAESSSSEEKSNSFVGTEEYVAPEVISGGGHDFAVDWWSLGVLLYEMLYGTTPFRGSNRKETFFRILTKPPYLIGEKTPLRDLIGKLLEKDPNRRITLEGIKSHDFFRDTDWDLVMGVSRPPYIPPPENLPAADGGKGIKRIEVEKLVEEMFAGNGKEADGGDDLTKNENNGVWVKELSSHVPSETNNFCVF